MASYSAFFSSGFLAPAHNIEASLCLSYDPPSSPILASSDVEDNDCDEDMDRESTPVRSFPTLSPPALAPAPTLAASTSFPTQGPFNPPTSPKLWLSPPRTLRKRRSSSSLAASPLLNAIKSPSRHAGSALQLQRRVRSGSAVSQADLGVPNAATEGNSLLGRMRSSTVAGISTGAGMGFSAPGTVGGADGASSTRARPRRAVRKIPTSALPARKFPAPTCPLPPAPVSGTSHSTFDHRNGAGSKPELSLRIPLAVHNGMRGSPSPSTSPLMLHPGNTIEEMCEN